MNIGFKVFFCFVIAGALVGCGGGGGGSSSSNPDPFTTLPAVTATKNRCASPRVGSSSVTGEAFPDVQGSLLDEQNFLAAWTYDTYLWYREVAYPAPASYSSARDYFGALKTTATTASGAAKDRFHFTYPTSEWESLSAQGVQIGYGANWAVIKSTPPRSIKVAYTDSGTTPANALSPALTRGATVLKVDGVDVVNNNTQSGVNTINAGLFPTAAGVAHTFEIKDAGSATTRTVTMTSANITSTPVQNVQKLAGSAVGYMQFNDHIATAESALIDAVTQLKSKGVTDLVIDIRYNGGGYLDIASELAYMVAGPTGTTGKSFELMTFNDKHTTVNPETKAAIAPTPFHTTAVGFESSVSGQALPYLGLSRVYVLTGPDTCSASEAIINGLRGVGVQVFQFGSKTCGKPYGFYPQANCGTTYFSIQFKGVNALGFGDYTDGFAPQNGAVTGLAAQAVLPGCSVADDYTHALGDPAEARLAAALQYRASNGTSCPTPATGVVQPQLRANFGESPLLNRPPPLTNRIVTPAR